MCLSVPLVGVCMRCDLFFSSCGGLFPGQVGLSYRRPSKGEGTRLHSSEQRMQKQADRSPCDSLGVSRFVVLKRRMRKVAVVAGQRREPK